MIKEFLKRSREKYLLPLRKQVYSLIDKDSRVIDIGCGNGELLRILSKKISYGLGIDKSKKEIAFAKRLTEKRRIRNLDFKASNFEEDLSGKFDYSILMFTLHTQDYDSRARILKKAKRNSDKLIIVDYEIPIKDKLLVYIDEILAGHHKRFRDYLRRGGIEKLIEKNSFEKFDTYKNYIKIWEIDNKKS